MYDVLSKSQLFGGLQKDELEFALEFFDARRKRFTKNEFLNTIGKPLDFFGLVLNGTVQVYIDDFDGHHMIMANVCTADFFGESLCWLGIDAPVYISAVSDAEVLLLNTERLKSLSSGNRLEHILAERFISMLAKRALSMNSRIQILSKLTLRGKLIAFFSQYTAAGSKSFTIPFDRSSMAAYLGTDRSALSRELSNMKKEGIIDFKKNSFVIYVKQ